MFSFANPRFSKGFFFCCMITIMAILMCNYKSTFLYKNFGNLQHLTTPGIDTRNNMAIQSIGTQRQRQCLFAVSESSSFSLSNFLFYSNTLLHLETIFWHLRMLSLFLLLQFSEP